jgi:predicted GIY-YIG superfamily endonuclease
MFHVYVLLSCKTGRRYVGSTDNVERRFARHFAGEPRSTTHSITGVPG